MRFVENYVRESHLISQCYIHADGRSYCVALVTLNEIEVIAYAEAHKIEISDAGDICRGQIVAVVDEIVERSNARVSSSEQIKRFEILRGEFLAKRNEITPTMKLKRDVIADNYKDVLENLYD